MFERFYTVAQNTFTETIRQPIYGVILIVTALLMVLNVSLAAFTLYDDDKLLLDLGLSTLLLSGLFLAAFSAAGVVSREIENKTVLTVISKPIGRPVFFFGKYVGLLAALAVAFYISFLIFVLAQRHGVLQNTADPYDLPVWTFGLGGLLLALGLGAFANYFYGRHFATTTIALAALFLTLAVIGIGFFDEEWKPIEFGSNYVSLPMVTAAYLVFLVSVILAAVAVAASTRFGQLPTLMICIAVLGLGIIADYAFGQHAADSVLANIAYRASPNVGPFWIIDNFVLKKDPTQVPLEYVGWVTLYAALISFGILNIGVVAFQRREVG